MKNVYAVTHPQATHHVEHVVGGWHDSELTPAGRQDAQAIGDTLCGWMPEGVTPHLLTSDLLRAQQTADIIGAHLGVAPESDRRLREKSYGEAEGRPQEWLDERFVPPPAHGERLAHDEGIEGAETLAQLADRVFAVMSEVAARDVEHQIISTHGGVLTFAVAAFLRVPPEHLQYLRLRARPGSITTLRVDDRFGNRELVELSSVAHLDPRADPSDLL